MRPLQLIYSKPYYNIIQNFQKSKLEHSFINFFTFIANILYLFMNMVIAAVLVKLASSHIISNFFFWVSFTLIDNVVYPMIVYIKSYRQI